MFDLMPFSRNERSLFDPFGMFDDAFFRGSGAALAQCRTDIRDQGDSYLVEADMPGFSKEEIKLDLQGDCLTIRAEHQEETKEEKGGYLRRERRYGGFSRSFDVSAVDTDNIRAAYNNGVLELTLPKKAEITPAQKSIEIQ